MDVLDTNEVKSSMPTDAASSSSFAAVLNILFSVIEKKILKIDWRTMNSLRLTCKAARDVFDTHVITFSNGEQISNFFGSGYLVFDDPLYSLSRWPWPNVANMKIGVSDT